jgi:hypothetical protein
MSDNESMDVQTADDSLYGRENHGKRSGNSPVAPKPPRLPADTAAFLAQIPEVGSPQAAAQGPSAANDSRLLGAGVSAKILLGGAIFMVAVAVVPFAFRGGEEDVREGTSAVTSEGNPLPTAVAPSWEGKTAQVLKEASVEASKGRADDDPAQTSVAQAAPTAGQPQFAPETGRIQTPFGPTDPQSIAPPDRHTPGSYPQGPAAYRTMAEDARGMNYPNTAAYPNTAQNLNAPDYPRTYDPNAAAYPRRTDATRGYVGTASADYRTAYPRSPDDRQGEQTAPVSNRPMAIAERSYPARYDDPNAVGIVDRNAGRQDYQAARRATGTYSGGTMAAEAYASDSRRYDPQDYRAATRPDSREYRRDYAENYGRLPNGGADRREYQDPNRREGQADYRNANSVDYRAVDPAARAAAPRVDYAGGIQPGDRNADRPYDAGQYYPARSSPRVADQRQSVTPPRYPTTDEMPAEEEPGVARFKGTIEKPTARSTNDGARSSIY